MKKAIIFCHGDLTNIGVLKKIITKGDYVICADGGAEYALQLNIAPNVVIGDFDSISPPSKKKLANRKVEFIKYSANKDKSDTQLAFEIAIKRGYKRIIIGGLLGTRLDHLITNIFMIERFCSEKIKITIVEGNQEIYAVNKKIRIATKKGSQFSLVPLGDNCEGVTTNGLQYVLHNDRLRFGHSKGISNLAKKCWVEIRVRRGTLLVFMKSIPLLNFI